MISAQSFQLALQTEFIGKTRELMTAKRVAHLLYHATTNPTTGRLDGSLTEIRFPEDMSYQAKNDGAIEVIHTLTDYLEDILQAFAAPAEGEETPPKVLTLGASFHPAQITINGNYNNEAFNVSIQRDPALDNPAA